MAEMVDWFFSSTQVAEAKRLEFFLLDAAKQKGPGHSTGPSASLISLTMSYFHTGTRTIIGAKAFHYPVRDGKEWYHLAMVIRLDFLLRCSSNNAANS